MHCHFVYNMMVHSTDKKLIIHYHDICNYYLQVENSHHIWCKKQVLAICDDTNFGVKFPPLFVQCSGYLMMQASISETNYEFTIHFYEFRNPLGLQCGECESGGPTACCDDVL